MNDRTLDPREWAGSWRCQRGQALIETALTVPILLGLLLGAAELARVAYAAIEISNAARAAVQYASQKEATMNDIPGITTAAQDDAFNLTGVTATPALGYSCSDGSTYSAFSKTCSDATAQVMPYITVETTANFDPLIHLPFLPNTITLHGLATENCLDCL